ncbi:MAG: helix-turn-helix domain-containing protein [Desulfuromonadaceae bacterium]|nr:helix-turn-helix domain-containing protein [Desulfuromonadaceae bacterium]
MNEENIALVTEEEVKSGHLKKLPDLKTLREVHGMTIEDIFFKTKISATILTAIENGEFDLLPAPVSTRKFIRIYAETVGIDAEIILAHYQRYVEEKQVVPEEVNVVRDPIASNRKPSMHYLLYAIPVVAIIAIASIIFAFFYEKETSGIFQRTVTVVEQKEAVTKPATAVQERPPEAAANVPVTAPPTKFVNIETTQTPGDPRLNLLIEATEDTWLNIAEDRNPPYQITLKTGAALSRYAREFFVIDVGNAAGVNITFLGKSLGNLGRKGQVVHLRLPQQ